MQGRSVDEYRAPLFLAWQLTNRCSARCIACCEESGPDKAWRDELTPRRGARPRAAHRRSRHPLSSPSAAASRSASPHCWEIFELLAAGGVALKLETDGSRIDDAAADRLAALAVAVRADLGRRRHRGHARARASRVELRGGDRRDRAPGGARPRAAVRLRPDAAQPRTRSSPPTISRPRSAAARSSPAR